VVGAERNVPLENPPYPEAVARAMAFIAARLEEQPSDPLPLDAIARAAYVSPEHLCRLFKTHTRHTPAETVRLIRLDRAAVLLARTNFSVGEIATLCGFPSQFHFARRFKEAFGQTPSDLRRAIASGLGGVPITRLLQI
ncbi:MAG: AraC family transcriptional regulator, partial [Alphaproteobacteria bacterium]